MFQLIYASFLPTKNLNFGIIFTEVMKYKLDIILLIFSCQHYEKWVSVRERSINLLLKTVTYIAATEKVTCIITIEYSCG